MSKSSNTSAAASRRTRPIGGIGRVLLWSGGSLWIGREVGRADTHSHYAIQITLALKGEFRVRGEADRDWRVTRASLVLSNHRHELDGCGSTLAVVFVEPESVRGRALRSLFTDPLSTELPLATAQGAITSLHAAFEDRRVDAELLRKALELLDELSGAPNQVAPVDARVAAAMQWVRAHLREDVTLQNAAANVHLSPSRLRHLFVAQTGISFRAYVRWARVETAVAAAFAGKTWTQAAVEAGFADSAHLSRTSRHMFGLSPAMLLPE